MIRFIIMASKFSLRSVLIVWSLCLLLTTVLNAQTSKCSTYDSGPLKSALHNATLVQIYDFSGPFGRLGEVPVATLSVRSHPREFYELHQTNQFVPHKLAGLASAVLVITERDGSRNSLGYYVGNLTLDKASDHRTFSGSAILIPRLYAWIKALPLKPR